MPCTYVKCTDWLNLSFVKRTQNGYDSLHGFRPLLYVNVSGNSGCSVHRRLTFDKRVTECVPF